MSYIVKRRGGLGSAFMPGLPLAPTGIQPRPVIGPGPTPVAPRPLLMPRPEPPPRGVIVTSPAVVRPGTPSFLQRPAVTTTAPVVFRRPPSLFGARPAATLLAPGPVSLVTSAGGSLLVPNIPQVSTSAGGGGGGGGGGVARTGGGGGGGGGPEGGDTGEPTEFDEFEVPDDSPTSSEFDAAKTTAAGTAVAVAGKKPIPMKTVAIGAAVVLGLYLMTRKKGR